MLKHSLRPEPQRSDPRGPTLEGEHDKMIQQRLPDIQSMFSQYCKLNSLGNRQKELSMKENLIQNGSFVLDNHSANTVSISKPEVETSESRPANKSFVSGTELQRVSHLNEHELLTKLFSSRKQSSKEADSTPVENVSSRNKK